MSMLRGVEGGKLVSGWAELVIMVDPDLASMPPHPIQGISWSFGDESSGSKQKRSVEIRTPWDLHMLYHTLGRNGPLSLGRGHSNSSDSKFGPRKHTWFDLVCAQPLNRHSRTGILGFHDVIALRTAGHERMDRFWNYDHQANHLYGIDGVSYYDGHDPSDLVPVTSCFGGLAIYRMEMFKAAVGCDYDPTYKPTDCEHVAFHSCLRRKGFTRMFIDPLLSSYYDRGNLKRECSNLWAMKSRLAYKP